MKPSQHHKRGRGRNNGNGRKFGNPLSRTYDSNGPEVKIRGTAQHIADKYAAMARDALGSGDTVMAENYLQHAEHYNRIIAQAQMQLAERHQRQDGVDDGRETGPDGGVGRTGGVNAAGPPPPAAAPLAESVFDGSGPQPVIDGTPAEIAIGENTMQQYKPPVRRRAATRPRRIRGAVPDGAPEDTGTVPSEPDAG